MRSIVIFWFYNDGQFIQVHKSGGEMVLWVTKILYWEIKKLNCSKSRKQQEQDDPRPQFGKATKTLTDSGFIIANWRLAGANKSKIKKWYKKQNTIKLSSNKTTQFNYSPTFPLFDDFMQCGIFQVNTLPKSFKLFFVKEMKNTFQNYQKMQKL